MKETVLRKIVEKNTMPPPLTARDGWRSTNARYWRSFFARSHKLTIFRKGVIIVAVPLLFQLALIGLVAVMQQQAAEANYWLAHTKEVLTKVETVLGKLVDLETGSRGYAITRNAKFTEPFDRAAKDVPAAIQELKTLVSDNPAQHAKVEALAAKASRFIEWHAERIQEVRDGNRNKAEASITSLECKNQMDAMRRDITVFRLEEERLDDDRTLRRDQGRQILQWVLIGGAVAALVVTLLLAFVFSRGIGGRLAVLAGNAGRLAQGKELAAPVGGADEISKVDGAFRDMAQTIRLYGDIVKSVPIGLLIWRLDNLDDASSLRIVDANPSASGLLGVDVRGMLGKTILQAFPSNTPEVLKAYADVVRTGTSTEIGEIQYGDERVKTNYWSVKAFPLPDHGLGLAFENISARKQAEDAIRRLNEELEQRVEERTAKLAETNRDLEHKNQENEMFVYSVSHDLRSPLVNLQGFSKELGLTCQQLRLLLENDSVPPDVRDRCLTLLDRDMAESVNFILTGVTRLSNIINALLRLSRAGRVDYQMQQVDVNRVVQSVVESMRSTITERGANVTVKELPPVCGDPTAVEQVFANLIGNALNYLDSKRPGSIEVGNTNSHDPEGSPTGPWVTYYVKDNGLGIPAAYQHKVFQAFQRVHPEVAKGEGMGLAIVHRAVERHRGKVWVESKAGEGSTFFVALPVSGTNGSLK